MSNKLPVFTEILKLKMDGEDRELDPQAYIRISKSILEEELMNQMEYHVFWGLVHSRYQAQADLLDLECDAVKADVDMAIRTAARESGEKTTEAQIAALINKEPAYVELKKALIESQRLANYTKTIATAFYKRYDVLGELAKNERGENYIAPNSGNINPDLNIYSKKKEK